MESLPSLSGAGCRSSRAARARCACGLAIALAFAPASPAGAEIHPLAQPIVDHYIRATGDTTRRAAEITLHELGRIEAEGMTGHWEQWTMAPDLWMRRFVLGPLVFREGYDGRVAWRTDLTNKGVQEESAADTKHAAEEGWFLNER